MTAAFPWEGVQVSIPAVYRFKKDQLTVFIRVRMKNSKNNHSIFSNDISKFKTVFSDQIVLHHIHICHSIRKEGNTICSLVCIHGHSKHLFSVVHKYFRTEAVKNNPEL